MAEQHPAKEWMKMIPESQLLTYKKGGYHGEMQLGKSPALIVVDVNLGFVGSRPQQLMEKDGSKEDITDCSESFWGALPHYQRVLELFRKKNYPVIFTRSDLYNQQVVGKSTKSARKITDPDDPIFNKFPEELSPADGEWILEKTKASAFFNTPLNARLVKLNVDTLVLCGGTTSGCLRATVVDAFSHGYSTFVVEDACFDRSDFAHCANLFDLSAKYAQVLSVQELENIII